MNRQSFWIIYVIYVLQYQYSLKIVTALHQKKLFIVGGTEITSKEGTTQGDPVSMAIYGIGFTPLINMLINVLPNEHSVNVNVMAYTDDFAAAGNLQHLRRCWSVLTEIGPKFGYYPEPTKTWLVAKPCASEKVESVFF